MGGAGNSKINLALLQKEFINILVYREVGLYFLSYLCYRELEKNIFGSFKINHKFRPIRFLH